MKAIASLPEGYREIYKIDLQKDTKAALLVNGLALVIALIVAVPMHFYIPITTFFDMSQGMAAYFIRFAVFAVLLILYMVLHELVHGITMKYFGTEKVKYGFTGLYAYAGSDDYYYKKPYITIALAPIVVWGIVLAIVNIIVPTDYFWVIYIIQVCNISGAAGDIFVTAKFSRMPKDILVHDYGVGMTVYSAE